MEVNQTDDPAGTVRRDVPGILPGMLDLIVRQVRDYEDEHGIVEPLDPSHPASGGRALSGAVAHRIAAIKGILIANGLGASLIRLERYADPPEESLLRGIVAPSSHTFV